jgi:pimeloyl-ACP methyl ester carboxylesterase
MVGAVAPWIPGAIARLLTPVLMPLLVGDMHPTFANDVLVEAEACARYDARPVLSSISIPVLVIGGDQDRYFPLDAFEETARSIPGAILRIHRGQGHMRVLGSRAAARQVVKFARSESVVTPYKA